MDALSENAMVEDQHPPTDTVLESTEAEDGVATHGSANDAVRDAQEEDDAGGLFGEGSEDEGAHFYSTSNKHRQLDDEELDSGDDLDRDDRMDDDMDVDESAQDKTFLEQNQTLIDVSVARHETPRGSDGELYHLKLPIFLGIEPKAFSATRNFQPPTTDHHSSGPPSATFSPHQTANNTIRWRPSPSNPSKMQSNARILRWSDGSMTLQLASNPLEQYELAAKPLAPPQRTPLKPTPTSTRSARSSDKPAAYDASLDSHTYLASSYANVPFVRLTNHVTAMLSVQSEVKEDDDALLRLQESMAAETKGKKTNGGLNIIPMSEDPELAKRKAELAEREKLKAQRRRQIQEEKERDRANKVLGRSGLRTGMSGGLTVGGLEDDDGMTTTKARANKPTRKPRRRNSEYSEDEEDYRNRGRTKEDEYDEDDGFLVRSDEEPEVIQDDSEDEIMGDDLDDGIEDKPKKKNPNKVKTGKDGEDNPGGSRAKRRHVVDDEDED